MLSLLSFVDSYPAKGFIGLLLLLAMLCVQRHYSFSSSKLETSSLRNHKGLLDLCTTCRILA
jgi:hypothetical protein